MSDRDKLDRIRAWCAAIPTIQDEWVVGLASEILSTIDGTVTYAQVEAQTYKHPRPETAGDALEWAKAAAARG